MAFGFRLNISAFIAIKGDPISYFSNTSNWVNVMKTATDVAQTFMADSILVSAALQLLAMIYFLCSCIGVGLSIAGIGE